MRHMVIGVTIFRTQEIQSPKARKKTSRTLEARDKKKTSHAKAKASKEKKKLQVCKSGCENEILWTLKQKRVRNTVGGDKDANRAGASASWQRGQGEGRKLVEIKANPMPKGGVSEGRRIAGRKTALRGMRKEPKQIKLDGGGTWLGWSPQKARGKEKKESGKAGSRIEAVCESS